MENGIGDTSLLLDSNESLWIYIFSLVYLMNITARYSNDSIYIHIYVYLGEA